MADRHLRTLLTWPCPAAILAPLEAAGAEIERLPAGADNAGGMKQAIAGKHALLCHPWVPVNEEVIAAAGDALRVISTYAVGYDNIDVHACVRRGIPVGHTPGVVVESTADVTYALVLAVMRGIISGDRHVRSGAWLNGIAPHGRDLFGKTLGIIGMGAIGTAVARRAAASGMKIAYTNRRPKSDAPMAARFLPMRELLAEADCVVLLAPLNAETRGMMDAAAFAAMKSGAFFVNAARGALVDTTALHDALASGHLGGAAVDVLEPEPIGADHPLLKLSNFFITPHIGTATDETRLAMAQLMIANAVAGLRGEPLPAAVPGTQ
ncbi:MAG: 2-hydroxyacid dehydrogenase [Candidatus Velthaea sp.]